jgi:hypothetical protein
MHLRKVLLAAIAVAIFAFSAAGLRGQSDFVDGIKVTLPEPVTVGDKVLQPGEYEIRRASQFQDQVLKIFNNDKMVYETNVITIPTEDKKTPEDSKVILHHIGDAYYFDKIWIQGKNVGYEFALPDKAKALQRELAVTVPAKYESLSSQSDQVAQVPVRNDGPGLAAELDALAAQQEREQAALRTDSQADLNNHEQQQPAPVQVTQERTDRIDQVAALQPEPAPVAPIQSDTRATQTPAPSSIQKNENAPEQLPATATNWLAFLFGGLALLTLAFVVRPRFQE